MEKLGCRNRWYSSKRKYRLLELLRPYNLQKCWEHLEMLHAKEYSLHLNIILDLYGAVEYFNTAIKPYVITE
jgi:hypothetical protein